MSESLTIAKWRDARAVAGARQDALFAQWLAGSTVPELAATFTLTVHRVTSILMRGIVEVRERDSDPQRRRTVLDLRCEEYTAVLTDAMVLATDARLKARLSDEIGRLEDLQWALDGGYPGEPPPGRRARPTTAHSTGPDTRPVDLSALLVASTTGAPPDPSGGAGSATRAERREQARQRRRARFDVWWQAPVGTAVVPDRDCPMWRVRHDLLRAFRDALADPARLEVRIRFALLHLDRAHVRACEALLLERHPRRLLSLSRTLRLLNQAEAIRLGLLAKPVPPLRV